MGGGEEAGTPTERDDGTPRKKGNLTAGLGSLSPPRHCVLVVGPKVDEEASQAGG